MYQGDDLHVSSLKSAISQSINYLDKVPSRQKFMYGNIEYTAEELKQSFHLFEKIIETNPGKENFIKALEANFHMFHSSANPGDQVLYTGYYEPLFEGSFKKTEVFNVPVYRKPDDLEVLELGRFRSNLKNRTIVYRRINGKLLPFFNRKQIMSDKVLAGKNLEIAWLKDPIDLFFMQVQGSGMIELPSGERIKLSYNGANGHKYSSIGKLLLDEGIMELEEISMESIRRYLDEHPEDRDRILYHNKSYTFLAIADSNENPRGNINVPLSPLRSIATDASIFPKGGLAYISTEVPEFDAGWNYKGTRKISRFVLNQDTGGAIKGTGRVDLFWGAGKKAEKSAGKLRSMGRVYFLVAKKEVLNSLNPN
ncbi:MAG: transglycosylase [Proteobacteria bacterium]|nr:transglycosylase [Pseudomonadota bacterium]